MSSVGIRVSLLASTHVRATRPGGNEVTAAVDVGRNDGERFEGESGREEKDLDDENMVNPGSNSRDHGNIETQDGEKESEDENMAVDGASPKDQGNTTVELNSDSGSDASSDSDSSSGSCASSDGLPGNLDGTNESLGHAHVGCIQEAQLSPDGSCIFTADYERTFSVYSVFSNNPEEVGTRQLSPYAQCRSADPVWSFAVNPAFDWREERTTTVLISRRDQYINLHNALWGISSGTGPVDISYKIASYKLINSLTEAVTAPLSLAYSLDGFHFYAGHQDRIAIFDINHFNEPIFSIPTIPSKSTKLKGGGVGFKGHITALSVSPSSTFYGGGILAAGSRTRYVGLYDGIGGEEVTHVTLPGKSKCSGPADVPLGGSGVASLKWSPDGNYLYIAERSSDAILIYDQRKFSLALGYCDGRAALSNQKFGFDLYTAENAYGDANHEIWAGGIDGKIRMWRDPHLKEGRIDADDIIEVGKDPVVSTLVHRSGGVVVAASGTSGKPGSGTGRSKMKGKMQGGGSRPRFTEWGCLDILGLKEN